MPILVETHLALALREENQLPISMEMTTYLAGDRCLAGEITVADFSRPKTVLGDKREAGRSLPKFGEWDVNDPATAEGYTVIFNKARNQKRSGDKAESPPKSNCKHTATLGKPQAKKWFSCMRSGAAE